MHGANDDITLTLPRSVIPDVVALSETLTDRRHALLERNTDGGLSPVERSELETLVQMAQFGQILSMARNRRGTHGVPAPRSGDLRELVFTRDGGRCRYCGLRQYGQGAVFHIDHVLPRSRGGLTTPETLVLQCPYCSLHKADKNRCV